VGHVFLLSLLAALHLILVAAATVVLVLPNPPGLMIGYRLGADDEHHARADDRLDRQGEAEHDGTVLTVLAFDLLMLMLLRALAAGYTFASDWTPRAVGRFKAWVGRHGRGPQRLCSPCSAAHRSSGALSSL
jgi:hypothetical protein